MQICTCSIHEISAIRCFLTFTQLITNNEIFISCVMTNAHSKAHVSVDCLDLGFVSHPFLNSGSPVIAFVVVIDRFS